MLFKKKMTEVYLTNNVELFGLVKHELGKAGIAVETKSVNGGTQNRVTGTFVGRFGEKTEHEIMYYIYTGSEDSQKAKAIVSEVLRRENK